jgi:hypothetical protein
MKPEHNKPKQQMIAASTNKIAIIASNIGTVHTSPPNTKNIIEK